jgi:hypothetical protein
MKTWTKTLVAVTAGTFAVGIVLPLKLNVVLGALAGVLLGTVLTGVMGE